MTSHAFTLSPLLGESVPWNVTAYVALGTIGILSVVYLVLQVAIASKKLFGKQPPMHEQIAALRAELITAAGRHEAEEEREVERLEAMIGGVDRDVRQLRQDIVSNGETRRIAIEGKVEAVAKENRAQCLSIHTRLDEMPARIIELLKNAGRIR